MTLHYQDPHPAPGKPLTEAQCARREFLQFRAAAARLAEKATGVKVPVATLTKTQASLAARVTPGSGLRVQGKALVIHLGGAK